MNVLFYFDYAEAIDQYFWTNHTRTGRAIQNIVNLEGFDEGESKNFW